MKSVDTCVDRIAGVAAAGKSRCVTPEGLLAYFVSVSTFSNNTCCALGRM